MTTELHFMRPLWLLAILPFGLLWWRLRCQADVTRSYRRLIAPHLLPHLLRGNDRNTRLGPLELAGVGWLVAIVAVAGPAWEREPAPFADDAAPLAVVVKVRPSMKVEDVQPDRLTRAVQKIHDLLVLRRGAKVSLIAYAGTAHVVVPATTDNDIIDSFAQALDPRIMPRDGDAAADALKLADETLAASGGGSILWLADGVSPEQSPELAAWRKASNTPVQLLPPLPAGPELQTLAVPARRIDARLVRLAADDSDVHAMARAARSSHAMVTGSGSRWKESGYWLTPVLALLILPFFRRGWTLTTTSSGR
jgi:Ca-activated chloride channel homolog